MKISKKLSLLLTFGLVVGALSGCAKPKVAVEKPSNVVAPVETETSDIEPVDTSEVVEQTVPAEPIVNDSVATSYLSVAGKILSIEETSNGTLLFLETENLMSDEPDAVAEPVADAVADAVAEPAVEPEVAEPAVEPEVAEPAVEPEVAISVLLLPEGIVISDNYKPTVGDTVKGFYPSNMAMIMIYPPQYSLTALVKVEADVFTKADTFNSDLVSKDNQLQLNVTDSVEIVNGTLDSLSGKDLLVFYGVTTRSIPAQTTPQKIIVLN